MDPADRVEKRRFVGREFLLWLWFESEVFDGTLATRTHGTFGLSVERLMVLSAGTEATRIRGAMPAANREAKEALALGKLPEAAGLHEWLDERDFFFSLEGDRLAITGLALPTVLDAEDEAPEQALLPTNRQPRKSGRKGAPKDEASAADEAYEAFHERMAFASEVEALLETLYRDFLSLRMGPAWGDLVVPAMRAWMHGDAELDAERYRARRDRALATPAARSRRAARR